MTIRRHDTETHQSSLERVTPRVYGGNAVSERCLSTCADGRPWLERQVAICMCMLKFSLPGAKAIFAKALLVVIRNYLLEL